MYRDVTEPGLVVLLCAGRQEMFMTYSRCCLRQACVESKVILQTRSVLLGPPVTRIRTCVAVAAALDVAS